MEKCFAFKFESSLATCENVLLCTYKYADFEVDLAS